MKSGVVFGLSRTQAVVEVVHSSSPVLDDPFVSGQIAAAQALSGIWGTGAEVLFALNVMALPVQIPRDVLKALLAGGASKAKEAGIPLLGGHSMQSNEPQYGLAVTGSVHPQRMLTSAGGQVGDVLILTKPIGTAVAMTALARKLASKTLVKQATARMTQLNQAAAEVFASRRFKVNALTSVMGLGLLGHALELAHGAKKRVFLQLESVPLLPEIAALAEEGLTSESGSMALKATRFPSGLPQTIKSVLAGAETNGGLLAAIPFRDAPKAFAALGRKGVEAWAIGQIQQGKVGLEVV